MLIKRIRNAIIAISRSIFELRKRKHLRTVSIMSVNTYADIPAVLRGLLSINDTIQGDIIRKYENIFSSFLGGGYAFSFGAGRVALASILEALNIGPNDEIILPGFTCVAVPNPIIFRGAKPIYVDIQPYTYNIDPEKIKKKITNRTKAIIVQHTFGLPAQMNSILLIAKENKIKIIEDCAHALGASYNGQLVGTIGDAAFFSTEQSKIISTVTGGIAYTRDKKLAEKIALFQSKCIWENKTFVRQKMAYVLYLILLEGPMTSIIGNIVGYYLYRLGVIKWSQTSEEELKGLCPKKFLTRLSKSQARLGIFQLKNLSRKYEHRKKIAAIYNQFLPELKINIPVFPPDTEHIYLRYPIWVTDKRDFVEFMRSKEIGIGVWFTSPVHPFGVKYENVQYKEGCCPNAEAAVNHVVNLPTHPRMNEKDAMRIIKAIHQYQKERQLCS